MHSPTPEQVRETRKEAKLSQDKAGALIGRSRRTFSRFETGAWDMPPELWELFLIKCQKMNRTY